MCYTVIKDDGHVRTRGKCRQHEPQASVFYISRVFSNVQSGLSQCNARLRLLHLLYDIEVLWQKTIKHAFSMFYTLINHGFFTNQSMCRVQSMLQYYINKRNTRQVFTQKHDIFMCENNMLPSHVKRSLLLRLLKKLCLCLSSL